MTTAFFNSRETCATHFWRRLKVRSERKIKLLKIDNIETEYFVLLSLLRTKQIRNYLLDPTNCCCDSGAKVHLDIPTKKILNLNLYLFTEKYLCPCVSLSLWKSNPDYSYNKCIRNCNSIYSHYLKSMQIT